MAVNNTSSQMNAYKSDTSNVKYSVNNSSVSKTSNKVVSTSNDNKNIDVFLQTKEAIWYRQPNYKEIKDFQQLEIDNNIVKVSFNTRGIYNEFLSDDFYSDVEIIDKYLNLNFENKTKYKYKNTQNIHKLSDEIYNHKIEDCFYNFYGYCPMTKNELYNHKKCHECEYLDINCWRCTYRFKDILKEEITKINNITYDRDGRVLTFDLEIRNQRKKYQLDQIPYYTKTLLEFSEQLKNFKIARFINIENNKTIQLTKYNMNTLINNKKCFGKICSDKYQRAYSNEMEIYNWNKPIWLLIWYKKEEYCEIKYNNNTPKYTFNAFNTNNKSNNNYSKTNQLL